MQRATTASGIPLNGKDQANRSHDVFVSDDVSAGKSAISTERKLLWRPSAVEMQYERLQLGPQQRISKSTISNLGVIVITEGSISIESATGEGRRQIFDFLMPRDAVLCLYFHQHQSVSFRSITNSSLIYPSALTLKQLEVSPKYWTSVLAQFQEQLARAYIKQIIIGCMDAEARVASFILYLALRGGVQLEGLVSTPMSREDIADYLAINRDTISRIMMRFEAINVIKRINRHAIRVYDIDKLRNLTPISGLLFTALDSYVSRMQNEHAVDFYNIFE
jgi:CRP/FNR family transcriptional regulator, anaerobic regulatory protein